MASNLEDYWENEMGTGDYRITYIVLMQRIQKGYLFRKCLANCEGQCEFVGMISVQ